MGYLLGYTPPFGQQRKQGNTLMIMSGNWGFSRFGKHLKTNSYSC